MVFTYRLLFLLHSINARECAMLHLIFKHWTYYANKTGHKYWFPRTKWDEHLCMPSLVFTYPNRAIHVCDVIVAQIQFDDGKTWNQNTKPCIISFSTMLVAATVVVCRRDDIEWNLYVKKKYFTIVPELFDLPVAVAEFFELTSFWLVKSSVDTINTRALLARVRCV